jgi:DNA-binding NarL/FixJ family response regulator
MVVADRGATIRVVIADDHPLIRANLRSVVNAEHDLECVGVAKSGREALAVTLQKLPDVLIVDAELRDLDGIDVAVRLRRFAPAVRTILYSAEPTIPELASQAHLAGFVTKSAPLEELLTAVRRAAFAARTQPGRK